MLLLNFIKIFNQITNLGSIKIDDSLLRGTVYLKGHWRQHQINLTENRLQIWLIVYTSVHLDKAMKSVDRTHLIEGEMAAFRLMTEEVTLPGGRCLPAFALGVVRRGARLADVT